MTRSSTSLRSCLGQAVVAALVVGDMLGSGVFFTPGELAAVADHNWQVYFVWALAGAITLCGALTLAELCTLLPRAGASYHFIREAFGPFLAFLFVWMSLWVAGPGAVAGVGILIGEFLHNSGGILRHWTPVTWGAISIGCFVVVNLLNVEWGGRTQVVLTLCKIVGIGALIVGGVWLAPPGSIKIDSPVGTDLTGAGGLLSMIRFTGLGIAAVLFTYDGWIDVSHLAAEIKEPERNFPRGLGIGVAALTGLYLIVNYAYLRVIPLDAMRQAPTTVASTLAREAYGLRGGALLQVLMVVSMLGAMGGLVMTLPRLYYAMASDYQNSASGVGGRIFKFLSHVSARSAVPSGAILFAGAVSVTALVFFGSFSKIVNFFVVPTQLASILTVASIFRLRKRFPRTGYQTPGYPITPLIYIVVLLGFLVSAVIYRPGETVIGLSLTASGIPVYFWLKQKHV